MKTRTAWAALVLIAVAAASCNRGGPAEQGRSPAGTSEVEWQKLAPALSRRTEVTAAAAGNAIVVAGGFVQGGSTVADVEIYDAATGRFRKGPDLPEAVNHPMSASLDGVVYVVGGYREGLSRPADTTFAFRGGSWQEVSKMPEPRAAGGAAAAGGKIYVAGGVGPDGLAASTLVFDPAADTWTRAEGLPTRREHLGVAAFEDHVYAVGGRSPDNLTAAEAFETATGKWSKLPGMPTARGGLAAAATSNGFIVAPGGEQASGTFAHAEAFDVRRGRWLRLPDLPTARHGLGVAAVETTVYVIAGGPEPGFAFSNANESIDLARIR